LDNASKLHTLLQQKNAIDKHNQELLKPKFTAPDVIEEVTEKICFSVGDIPDEELPAAISALKCYISDAYVKADAWSSMRKGYKRKLTLHVSIIVPDEYRASIIRYCIPEASVVSAYHGISLDSFDMYKHIDTASVAGYKAVNKFHAAQVYGVVLGCQAFSMFEIPLLESVEVTDVLVLEDAQLWETLGKALPSSLTVRLLRGQQQKNFKDLIRLLAESRCVVGALSLETYLACCLKKKVVELYPTKMSRSWLSKWSNKYYKMIVKDKLDTAEDLALAVRSVIEVWKMTDKLSKQQAVVV
jgi:hypothetical protein